MAPRIAPLRYAQSMPGRNFRAGLLFTAILPVAGARQAAEAGHADVSGQAVTSVHLALQPVSAVFLVSE
jgi:hypothetical protein